MLRTTITLEETIDLLNELVCIDPEAMRALVETRVPCNKGLTNHSTVQVAQHGGEDRVGLLGILNGLFGVLPEDAGHLAGYGLISGVYNDQGNLVGFQQTDPTLPVFKTRPLLEGGSDSEGSR